MLLLNVAAAQPDTSAVEAFSSSAESKAGEYVISPDDVLSVYVLDVPELSREYRVAVSGAVSLPLVDKPIPAAGLTLSQFSLRVEDVLKTTGLVSNPHVTTSVTQSRMHAVAITGAVKKPQIYQVLAQTTLLDLLSQAEGLADDASSIAIVYRGEIALQALASGGQMTPEQLASARTISVDLIRLMQSGDPSVNVVIYPGDRVTVPRAGIVYVVGAVNRPGGFPLRDSRDGMTVLQAVALAGDLKGTAIGKKAVIIRKDAQSPGGRKQMPVDLKKVLAGSTQDAVLQAEDILFVPDSSSQRVLRRGAEAVIQAATGMIIYHPF